MLNRKFMMLVILLVSLLAISGVSAAENATDDVIGIDETDNVVNSENHVNENVEDLNDCEILSTNAENADKLSMAAEESGPEKTLTYNGMDENVLSSVLNQDIEKIRRTLEETSKEDFKQAVNAITKAKTIYIFAVRSSAALASFLGYYYSLIFENVKVISNYGETEIHEKLFRISSDDVIIGISFPRYSNAAIKAMTFAHHRGAKVIALTDSMSSPLVSVSDYVLIAKSDMASVVDSLVAPLSMINALVVATVLDPELHANETFDMLENIWKEYDVYRNDKEEN